MVEYDIEAMLFDFTTYLWVTGRDNWQGRQPESRMSGWRQIIFAGRKGCRGIGPRWIAYDLHMKGYQLGNVK